MKGKELALAVTPSVKLRKSQSNLYAFILEKYNSGKVINLKDVIVEYKQYGCKNKINGNPAYYAYDWKNHTHYLSELKGDMLNSWALQWFIRNLGVFVIKGLLTAIPTMNLKDIEVLPEETA